MGRFTRCAIVGFVEGGAIENRIRSAVRLVAMYGTSVPCIGRASWDSDRHPHPSVGMQPRQCGGAPPPAFTTCTAKLMSRIRLLSRDLRHAYVL